MNQFLKTVVAGSALVLAGAANAVVVFSQPYDGTGVLHASQNDDTGGNGNFATVWDDFQLAATTNLNGVAWTGGYWNGNPAVISSFHLGIYANDGGVPGGLMAYGDFGGNANENCAGGTICTYSVAFGDYQMAPGTYWLALVPTVGFPPQWGWATSAVGNSNAYQCFFNACGAIGGGGTNMAFDVMGTPAVPEPETWALMLLGLGGLGAIARSRRKPENSAV